MRAGRLGHLGFFSVFWHTPGHLGHFGTLSINYIFYSLLLLLEEVFSGTLGRVYLSPPKCTEVYEEFRCD